MNSEVFLSQIKKIERIIANRENDHYAPNRESDIAELQKRRQDIIHTIEQLPTDEMQVLYEIYVNGKQLKELPSMFNRSYKWVGELKKEALLHVQLIINKQSPL